MLQVFRNQHQLLVTMDSRLNGLFPREEATRLLTIALTCVAKRDSARPEMIEVLRGLESISGGVSIPADPPPKEDASQEDAESWFGSSLRDSESSADGLSIRSHSTWSQLSSTGNTGHSLNYQMTMIHEGR